MSCPSTPSLVKTSPTKFAGRGVILSIIDHGKETFRFILQPIQEFLVYKSTFLPLLRHRQYRGAQQRSVVRAVVHRGQGNRRTACLVALQQHSRYDRHCADGGQPVRYQCPLLHSRGSCRLSYAGRSPFR